MATSTSCTGSTLLQPISKIIDLPLDQVNFVVCQLFALVTAFWFRLYLHPSKTSPFIRHVVATLLGFYLALFCFGWYALHFLVQSGLAYGVMIFTGVEHMHKYCFVVTLGYLSFCQVTRVYVFDYGMYSADFTGPMMVITQKITSLAFEIHDGLMKREEHLKPSQKYLAVRKMPSLLEYLSYNCNFMGILAGPTCSYNDYVAFIEGRCYEPKHLESNGKENGKFKQSDPSPKRDMIQKVCTCALSLMVYLVIYTACPTERVINDTFMASNPFYIQVLYLYAFKVIQFPLFQVRHNVRQHFLGSATLKLMYDVITWFSTQMAICYTVVPFVLLAVGPSLKFYSSWYCCIHLLCVLLVLVLPVKSRRTKQQASEHNCLSSPDNNCNQKQKAT
uniref:Membrane bound O-acyltransferase domain containing 2a n=1 Tax=Sinocyclocheilus anshuiensis TaxID=1608454 RepID=A0A671K6X2_9TELE